MLRATTLCLVLSAALAVPGSAQFGNLGRKAKEKAQQAITGQPPAGTPKFDNTILELTPNVVNQVIAGLRVRAATKDAKGRNAAQLRALADTLNSEQQNLENEHGNERFEFNNKLGNAESCVSDILNGIKQEQMNELQRKIMGMVGTNLGGDQSAKAKWMQEYQRLGMEQAAAMAAGDTAKASRIQAEYNKFMGWDPKADSVKARARCNVPPAPPWMVRADLARDSANIYYGLARDVEQKSNEGAIRASGLTGEQFMMALERVTAFMARSGPGNGAVAAYTFTRGEVAALEARRKELTPLVEVWR